MRMMNSTSNSNGRGTNGNHHSHPSRRRISFEDEYDDVHSLVDSVGGVGIGGATGGGGVVQKPDTLGRLLLQEARAVSLWSCIATLFRLCLILLSLMANYPNSSHSHAHDDDSSHHNNQQCSMVAPQEGDSESCSSGPTITDILASSSSTILQQAAQAQPHKMNEFLLVLSTIAGVLLCLLPSKVATQQAPGFSLGNPWLLLWIRDKTGVIPNVPIRICEYMLGRINCLELFAIIPIHVVCIVSTSIFLRSILPDSIASLALDPIEYGTGNDGQQQQQNHLWILDLMREALVTTVFVVSIMVLPALFQLNKVPQWVLTFLLYPLFNYSIDWSGKGSTFSPNVVLALAVLGHRSMKSIVLRLFGSLLGGFVSGRIMQYYFPDDDYDDNSNTKKSPTRF